MINCGRCNAIKRRIRKGTIRVVGPNGSVDHVCQDCYDELNTEAIYMYMPNENEENERLY